jgi:hypothetical protein
MKKPPFVTFFVVVFSVVAIAAITARPAAGQELFEYERRVRTADVFLQKLLRDGVVTSPTLRKLVARLQASDVVVYLSRDRNLQTPLEGKTTFTTAAGSVRYVAIGVAWGRIPTLTIATIAHELQHAVEIADAPWVIDEESLAREYRRIGFRSTVGPRAPLGRAFESAEAMAVGQRVWREFVSRSADD